MGKLLVVPTPIGNLRDITLRALDVLREVNYIACEDTRRIRILLSHYGIKGKKLIPYYEPKERYQIPRILRIVKKEDTALVSDAGMPAISDPGYRLIRACVEEGIEVEVLPGPSSILTALVGSGLPTDRFLFLGFPPKKGRRRFFEELTKYEGMTVVLLESPKRVVDTLGVLLDVVGDVEACVARELSKVHEEYVRGSIREVLQRLKEKEKVKGEVVVLIRL
ncbi:MAG TPA: 16S rRNA (cytidine(1402)-2'-O)-methyltransferase [Aquificaceae bacterium]|nr:16S rRNA (cytidine(1402)-2'-O)-methyltransferase [Aquificaceae bacterium]